MVSGCLLEQLKTVQEIKMNFDIKDVKSWSNRYDVKIGDEGYFFNDIDKLRNSENEYIKPVKSKLSAIRDNYAMCFQIDNGRDCYNVFNFFLPLDAVKKDKPKKKYRPFKSMSELTEIIYSKDLGCDNLSVGDSLWIRRKGDEHYHQNLLITSLGYDENDVISILISMNGKSMQQWLDEFEFLAHDEWKPFGAVEDCTGE